MKGIFGWSWRSNREAQAAEARPQSRVTIEHVAEFLKYFPMGTRLQYYPGYEKNTHLNTVILAYSLDRILVYSNEDIRFSQEEGNPELLFATESGKWRVSNFDSFHFVVPQSHRALIDYTSATSPTSEGKLAQRVVNDFRVGHTITLLNKGLKGKVHDMDTEVARVAVLTEGYYAKRQVAYLQPFPETLAMHSRREFVRIYTNISAILTESLEGEAHPCTIIDFSERALRAELADGDRFCTKSFTGKSVFINVALPPPSQAFLLQATVLRIQGNKLILSLTGMRKGHRFGKLDLIDEIELKSSLLQHLANQQLCSVKDTD